MKIVTNKSDGYHVDNAWSLWSWNLTENDTKTLNGCGSFLAVFLKISIFGWTVWLEKTSEEIFPTLSKGTPKSS